MSRRRNERGQAIVLVAIAMAVLLGFAALAIDVGSWFHVQRQLQAGVDAAALAGAQDLPTAGGTVANADTTATNVLTANLALNPDAGAGTPSAPSFSGSFTNPLCSTSNCIGIDVARPATGFLAPLLSAAFGSVDTHARAQAFLGVPTAANNVSAAPLQLSEACDPSLGCSLPESVTLDLDAAGSHDTATPLLDLDTKSSTDDTITSHGVSTTQMNTWLTTGYDGDLPVGDWYAVDGGAHNGFKQAFLDDVDSGQTLILPVWDEQYPATGTPTAYHVVGFAAFVVTSVVHWSNGSGHILQGNLVDYIATGLTGGPCQSCQNFGVFVVGLDG